MRLKTFIIVTFILAVILLSLVYISNIFLTGTAGPEKVVAGILGR